VGQADQPLREGLRASARGRQGRPATARQEGSAASTLLLLGGPLAFLLLFFYYPLGSIMAAGVTDDAGRFSLTRLAGLLADPYYLRIVGFTLGQALLSTLLSVALGLPGAYLMARFEFRAKGALRALTTIPFVLPSIIVVLGFVRFFGNNGILNRFLMDLFGLAAPPLRILYSFQAILLAHAFYNFPICIRMVSALWSRLDPRLEEAARSLGAHGPRLFLRVTLPQLLPGILASAALIFLFCFMSFAVVLVLGGGPRFSTLEVEVYRLAKVSLDLQTGSALAAVGASLSLLLLYGYIRLQQRASFSEEPAPGTRGRRLSELLNRPMGWLLLLYLALSFAVILAPMLTVVLTSFQERSGWSASAPSLAWYGRLFSLPGYRRAIANSLFFGAMTVALSLPLGTLLAVLSGRKRFPAARAFEALAMLPLGVSSVVLGLGYLRAYRHFPWKIVGSWYAVVFAHTVIAYPFVIRAVSSVFNKIPPSLPEAARSLGASSWQLFFHLELPLIKPALIAAAAFAFGISVGEINATLMLVNPELITIPVAIYRLISSYNFIGACAMGTILMLLCFFAFLAIDRAGRES